MSRPGVDQRNVELLDCYGDEWWSDHGRFGETKKFTDGISLPFLKDGLDKVGRISKNENLKGLKVLDVGCGVGVYSEAIAKTGAEVVGIDPGENLIKSANKHKLETLKEYPNMKVDYLLESIEEHAEKHHEEYDVVVASEVIEHVPDPDEFLKHCIKTLKPGGTIQVTTFNRTILSFVLAQLLMSFILNIIPRFCHSWFRFVKPEECESIFNKYNCHKIDLTGYFYLLYLPVKNRFFFMKNTSIGYAIQGIKNVKYHKD
jgi:ubiquinone biosynthesis O-methyltransferase